MVRQDLVAGIRNAMERGYNMDQAKRSLLNSGYNEGDIMEAANYLTGGLGNQPLHDPTQGQHITDNINSPEGQGNKNLLPTNPVKTTKTKKAPFSPMIIILILILVALLGVVVISFVFKDSLISFFKGLF